MKSNLAAKTSISINFAMRVLHESNDILNYILVSSHVSQIMYNKVCVYWPSLEVC